MVRGQERQILGIVRFLLPVFCLFFFFQTTSYSREKQRVNITGKVYYQGPGRIKKVVPLVPVKLIRVRRGKTMTFIESQTDKNGDFALRSSRPVVGGEYRIWVEFEKNGVVYRGMATKQVPDSKDFDLNWKLEWSANIVCSPVGETHEEKKETTRSILAKERKKALKKIEEKMLSMSHPDLISLARANEPIFELDHKFIRARETKKAAAGGIDLVLFLQGIQVPERFFFETEVRVHKTYHLTRWCPVFGFIFRKGKEQDYIHTTRNNIHFAVPQCRRREKTFDLLDYTVISRQFLWHLFHPKTEVYEPIPPGSVAYTFSQPILFFEKEWGKIGILKKPREIFVFLDQKLIRQVPYSKMLGYFSSSVGYMDVEFRDLKVYPIKPQQGQQLTEQQKEDTVTVSSLLPHELKEAQKVLRRVGRVYVTTDAILGLAREIDPQTRLPYADQIRLLVFASNALEHLDNRNYHGLLKESAWFATKSALTKVFPISAPFVELGEMYYWLGKKLVQLPEFAENAFLKRQLDEYISLRNQDKSPQQIRILAYDSPLDGYFTSKRLSLGLSAQLNMASRLRSQGMTPEVIFELGEKIWRLKQQPTLRRDPGVQSLLHRLTQTTR